MHFDSSIQTINPCFIYDWWSRLNLTQCKRVTDRGMMHVASLAKLTHLNLSMCHLGLTDDTLATIAPLPLTSLDLSYLDITDSGLRHLVAHSGTGTGTGPGTLKSLNLQSCDKITDGGLACVGHGFLGDVTSLALNGCTKLTNHGVVVSTSASASAIHIDPHAGGEILLGRERSYTPKACWLS